jgi:hypothetical protein
LSTLANSYIVLTKIKISETNQQKAFLPTQVPSNIGCRFLCAKKVLFSSARFVHEVEFPFFWRKCFFLKKDLLNDPNFIKLFVSFFRGTTHKMAVRKMAVRKMAVRKALLI